jgi:Ca2+-binding RTX toxin-like protein
VATINGTSGDDVLNGTVDADAILGVDGNDTLNGSDGDDILAGGAGADSLDGGTGNDTLYAGDVSPYWQAPWPEGVEYITPVLDRGAEIDTLNGGAGFDQIFAGYGDVVNGGADGAELLISLAGSSAGLSVDFSQLDNGGTLTIGGGLISNISGLRWVEGTNFDDTITGSNALQSITTLAPIFGLGGNDHIIAGAGTGSIYGGDGNDRIESDYNTYGANYYGDDGDDVINVLAGIAYGGNGNDTLTLTGDAYGGAGNDTITAANNTTYILRAFGDAGDDTLTGGSLGDSLSGGDGSDTVNGGDGDDLLMSGGTSSDLYPGIDQRERADFGSEHDVVNGGAGNDTIYAGYGDDVDGGTGTNALWFSLAGASSGVTLDTATLETGGPVQIGGGTITNIQQVAGLFGSNFADVLTLSQSATVEGLGGDDTINGSSGYDEIYGGAGADIIHAGGGDDVIWIEADGDAPAGEQIDGGDGIDTLFVGPNNSYLGGGHISLGGAVLTSIEYLSSTIGTLVGVTNAQLSGVAHIYADLYFTEPGAISLTGKESRTGNTVFELNPGGNQLDLSGFTATYPSWFTIRGGDGADTLIGSAGQEDASGGGGSDSFDGGAGSDSLHGEEGNDTLAGGADGDWLDGGDGNDTLIGGDGIDELNGGLGDDFYIINSAADHGAAEIYDTSGSNTLVYTATTVSTLTLYADDVGIDQVFVGTQEFDSTGTAAINVDASALFYAGTTITGNAGANVLTGSAFADVLQGGAGADKLLGGGGNDTLDGGAGLDNLYGGAGNDSYYVDSYSDKVIENAGEGADSVFSTTNYKLGTNVENLTLTGSGDLWAYGNADANTLTGNAGANKLYGLAGNDVLKGGAGIDKMFGGAGDDAYFVDSYSDAVVENAGEGTDSVFASTSFKLGANVEKLTLQGSADLWGYGNAENNTLTGNTGANKLYGLAGNDTLSAGAGADWLEGGAGQDKLSGGADNDSFVFRDGDFAGLTTSTCDEIKDFATGDKIRLNLVDANTGLTGDQAFAFIGTSAFSNIAGELRYEQISGNTYVEGDTNGDGLADFMIKLDGLHTLVSGDFGL